MFEKVKDIFYEEYDSILSRLRNGGADITQEERDTLISFSEELNQKIRNNENVQNELLASIDIIYSLMYYYPDYEEIAFEMQSNILDGVDY